MSPPPSHLICFHGLTSTGRLINTCAVILVLNMLKCCDDRDTHTPRCTHQLYKGFPFLRTPLCCSPIVEDDRLLAVLVSEAAVYSAANGLMMMKNGVTMPVPCTLLPTPFPRIAYDRLQTLSVVFNTVYYRVSRDCSFLSSCLAETAKVDPFIARLLRVAEIVRCEGEKQALSLCINRSDYMMHATEDGSFTPQQVEFNTISAGMACLSSKVSEMHAYLVSRHAPHYAAGLELPVNTAMERVVQAMASACHLYESQARADKTYNVLPQRASVLMVVQKNEWNMVDQQLLAFTLWKQHAIPLVRKTLGEIYDEATTDEDGQLVIEGRVISLAYFRAGYTPRDFPSEKEWAALLQIERSLAIKCPTVAYHLAGCKRVQQVLSSTGALEQFISADEAALIHSSFTDLWALHAGADDTRRIVSAALADPALFVLKPQREGGGNNLWSDEMVEKLKSASAEELAAYILMRRINAPAVTAAGVRQGELFKFRGINEMGIFGVFLCDGETVHVNAAAGYLLRTKGTSNHEGGISAGSGFIDSVVLV